jgi:hypothetical protein
LNVAPTLNAATLRFFHLHRRAGLRVTRDTGRPFATLEGAEAGQRDPATAGHLGDDLLDDRAEDALDSFPVGLDPR